MTRAILLTLAIAAIAAAPPRTPTASSIQISFTDGRVTIVATDALVGDVLTEWARVGGTAITGAEKLPAERISVSLEDIPEAEALAAVAGSSFGYIFTRRPQPVAGLSSLQQVTVGARGARPVPGKAAATTRRGSERDASIPEARFDYGMPMADHLDSLLKEKEEIEANAPPPLSPAEAQVIPELRFYFPPPIAPDSPPEPETGTAPDPKPRKPPSGR